MQLHSSSCRIRFPCPLSPGLAILFLFFPFSFSTLHSYMNISEHGAPLSSKRTCTSISQLSARPFCQPFLSKRLLRKLTGASESLPVGLGSGPKQGTQLDGNGGTNKRQLACQQAKCRETYMEKGGFEDQTWETSLCAVDALPSNLRSSWLPFEQPVEALSTGFELRGEDGVWALPHFF